MFVIFLLSIVGAGALLCCAAKGREIEEKKFQNKLEITEKRFGDI